MSEDLGKRLKNICEYIAETHAMVETIEKYKRDHNICEAVTTNRDRRRAKIGRLRSTGRLAMHGVWWRLLWNTRLAKPYSRFMYRHGWYRKFELTGVCMYCGKAHT